MKLTAAQLRRLELEYPVERGQIEAALADRDLIDDAVATVQDAIDRGVLVVEEEGTFGGKYGISADNTPEKADSGGDTPTPDGGETTDQGGETGVEREAAVAALRDILTFYNDRLDDTIQDHTDEGEHPDRPTTAREYFVERRGWDNDTVDELLLGWAPPNHVDELVAYLFDRGHSREAILATGAIGESDTGGFYTTFNGRYVLPYFDATGRPAYAIARATGGDGGGGRGYGGHPDDYQAGKYAKLRHTDERVPFAEPIYGLDTLEEADHVVIAEGIADAITARSLGYAVLSPVTRQFKEEHYDPLVEALEEHNVSRVTIVADNDSIHNRDVDTDGVEEIGEVVDLALEEVGAGLDGALRTAANLNGRAAFDVRVTVPPAAGDLENDLDDYVTGQWGDLDTLLAAARPPEAFGAYDSVVEADPGQPGALDGYDSVAAGERPETFNAQDYEPRASSASETTDEIRDIYHALDRLDARRVARKTITREVLSESGHKQTIAPTWAPAGYDGTAVFVDRDKFVDTGSRGGRGGPAVMAAIDAGLVRDTQTPDAVEGETWWKAVDHLRSLGFDIPEYEDSTTDDYRRDPREVEATVDPRRAYEAANRVGEEDITGDLPALSEPGVTVVRAVAVAEGFIQDLDEPLDDAFPKAYAIAREDYDAPLPQYYTTADAVAQFDALLDLLGEVTFWDIDADALNTEITVEEADRVGGAAVRALNPAWRESESGESVLVFGSGNVWDADTETSIDMLRLAALDRGLIDEATDPVKGENFTEAYRVLRDELGAPLPRWDPATEGGRDHTPMLPPAEDIVGEPEDLERDTDRLDEARKEVEELIGDALDEEEPSVVTALPALGKTTGTIKNAKDTPLSYLAPRKELQQQAVEKAERWGVSYEVLPVFSEVAIVDDALEAAVDIVRDEGEDQLHNRWALLDKVASAAGVDPEEVIAEGDDEEEVDLGRPSCPTANGDHGDAWALAVHVARELGYKPRQIHQYDRGLFGGPLPCDGGCEYGEGWERAADRDDPPALLIGSYAHAHVPSVSQLRTRDRNGDPQTEDRPIVLDEFPGGAFTTEFDDDARKHATWLATALREDLDDETDMLQADLYADEWVDTWLQGDAGDLDGVQAAVDELGGIERLLDAKETVENILDEVDRDLLEEFGLFDPLEGVLDRSTPTPDARESLVSAVESADPQRPGYGVVRWVKEAVVDKLPTDEPDPEAIVVDVPIGEGLQDLLDAAIEAARDGGAREVIHAAKRALKGGPRGCEALAAWADHGYAHPDAHHFLQAVATPTGENDPGDRLHMTERTFDDAREETVADRVKTGEKAVTILDRNGDGALLHTPPNVTAPIVGLDATARRELWANILREGVTLRDIHDTDAERATFLEEVLGLSVVQAADSPRFYEGDPATKDTEGDVALLESIVDEYGGVRGARDRCDEADTVGDSVACITSKGVQNVLAGDDRLDGVVDTFAHYGDIQGRNDLKDARLAAILGTQHFGDGAIEEFAAIDGREVDTDRAGGRGGALDYGDRLANEYLQHMTEDQTMQAILRFTRGGSGATVVARTSALRGDLPVIGKGQVVQTWSDTATTIARAYRRIGDTFTVSDVVEAVDVSRRQVRRVLGELEEAGYVDVDRGGRANEYEPVDTPTTGEVELLGQNEALANNEPGRGASNRYYTWNVRVLPDHNGGESGLSELTAADYRAPPAPSMVDGGEPPG